MITYVAVFAVGFAFGASATTIFICRIFNKNRLVK